MRSWAGQLVLWMALCAPAGAADRIRIASWNIHQGRQADRVLEELERPELLAELDILALQETQTLDGEDLARAVAERRGWRIAGNASNAILTRWPILDSGGAAIGLRRSREAPWVDIETPAGTVLRVYSVHLTFREGWHPFDQDVRWGETGWLLYHAKELLGRADRPIVLAGDFNTVGRLLWGHENERALALLRGRGFRNALPHVGGATHLIFGRLDWIFVKNLHPVRGRLGEAAGSDHRWLWAELSTVPVENSPEWQDSFSGSLRTATAGIALLAALVLAIGMLLVRRRR